MSSYLIALAALAVGYTLGRLRPGHRASDWAAWVNCTSTWKQRRYRWPALAVMFVDLIAQLTLHPVESYRNQRSWKRAESEPAPTYESQWIKPADEEQRP